MNDVPHIDDRRRFRELWKELLYARVLGALLGLLLVSFGILCFPIPGAAQDWALGGLFLSLGIAAPTSIARHGRFVFLIAGGSVAAALALVICLCHVVPDLSEWGAPRFVVAGATLGAALGLTEGILGRSVATMCSGLLGGTVAGLLTLWVLARGQAWFLQSQLHQDGPEWLVWILLVAGLWAVLACLHLGIGLALALGRWIRDLPKRKQEQPETTE